MLPKFRLHLETTGRGSDVFLIHGWGLHGGVWETLVPKLAAHCRVTWMDLPGHGGSRGTPMPEDLRALAAQVLGVAPQQATWLGWSLGGMVALRAALDAPERVHGLILANTTPKFAVAPDWECAMPLSQLQQFAADLATDYRACIRHFLTLQVRGDEHAQPALRMLRASLFARGEPDPASLAAGLEILRVSDLRTELSCVHVPALVVAGGYDRLTPPAAGRFLSECLPDAEFALMAKSAHAPFLSHPQAFAGQVLAFLERRAWPESA